jgi:ketosteroid isomerase-like protein
MDLLIGHAGPAPGKVDSPNMLVVKGAFDAFLEHGVEAGVECLLRNAHEDCEFRPYSAQGRVLRGVGEFRAYIREREAEGTTMTIRPGSFHEVSPEIVVANGSVRVARPGGGFSESQISWTYHFRDGRLTQANWGPRQAP